MIEIKDIKDQDSLEKWLTDWPKANGLDEDAARAVAVTIAHRVAMRVLPKWLEWYFAKSSSECDFVALMILRACLISGTAAKLPTSEIKYAAAAAASATDHATAATSPAAAAAAAPAAAFPATAAAVALTGATAFGFPAGATWELLRIDCNNISRREDVLSLPLWINVENPVEEIWREVAKNATGPEWAFWVKWYQEALEGRPQNWKMLEQIALIGPEVWEAGAEVVAERIGEIEREFDGVTEISETNLTPEQALAKNSKVVLLQLDVLKLFVEEEIQTLRAPNDISKEVMARIVLLEGILASVAEIQAALNDNNSSGENALAIVEERLPEVFEAADKLADNSGSTEVSGWIKTMGTTIEHLTKRGTSGSLATGIAFTDAVVSAIKKSHERRKASKDKGG
jgi:hypothetical protein